MRQFHRIFLLFLAATVLFSPFAAAKDEGQRKEFDRIANMKMADLTRESAALLEKKYPEQDWEASNFPSFVFTSESVEVGYKIAVVEPELLGSANVAVMDQGIPCYCFCDVMGHKNLLSCFWQEGKAGGTFDDHAAGCDICNGQAMLAFLWKNLGASDQEILQGMEKKFARVRP